MENVYLSEKELALVGRRLQQQQIAPYSRLITRDLEQIKFPADSDKIKVINTFLCLDNRVCDSQIKQFNQRAADFLQEVVIFGISKDLPFACRKYSQANNIYNLALLSDYHYSSFGFNYGLQIREVNLLVRSAVILDKKNRIRYFYIEPDTSKELDYSRVFAALDEIIENPDCKTKDSLPAECRQSQQRSLLTETQLKSKIAELDSWSVLSNKKIGKEYFFDNFEQEAYFVDMIREVIRYQQHYPLISFGGNKVTVVLGSEDGVSDNDFIVAKIIDCLKF
jgi:thiol peroxidase